MEEINGNILEGIYFCMKNLPMLNERPESMDHDVFKRIFEVSELLNMDEETRSKVIHNMTTERDLRNQMAYARQEAIQEGLAEGRAVGRAEGIVEGRAEGRAEGAANALIEVAGKMLVSGEPIEKIMAFTGLNAEIIEGLKNR